MRRNSVLFIIWAVVIVGGVYVAFQMPKPNCTRAPAPYIELLVRETGRLAPGSRVLAVADGEGRNSVWLAQNGMKVHALDVSPVALEKARRLAARNGVS